MGKRPEKAFLHLYEDIQKANRYMNDGHVTGTASVDKRIVASQKLKREMPKKELKEKMLNTQTRGKTSRRNTHVSFT